MADGDSRDEFERLAAAGKRLRIGIDGRILKPEEMVSQAALRPDSIGRGLHAIVEPTQPWRNGKPVRFGARLRGATAAVLWFRLDDRPIEGTYIWDRVGDVVGSALALALQQLATDNHLIVTGAGEDAWQKLVDPAGQELTAFLCQISGGAWWTFRAYCGPKTSATGHRDDRDDFARAMGKDLSRWLIVADLVYDAGALEVWSSRLNQKQLEGRIDLDVINSALSAVDLSKFGVGDV